MNHFAPKSMTNGIYLADTRLADTYLAGTRLAGIGKIRRSLGPLLSLILSISLCFGMSQAFAQFTGEAQVTNLEQQSLSNAFIMDQNIQGLLTHRMTDLRSHQPSSEHRSGFSANELLNTAFHDRFEDRLSDRNHGAGFLEPLRTKSGVAFMGSAILPGSAQFANGKPLRGALYLAIEAGALILHADQQSKARRKEREYESYANSNWSVVKYARWLVGYHDYHNLSNSRIEELRNLVRNVNPAFSIDVDWKAIPIRLLRDVERNTLYVYGTLKGANSFSHVMPDYGSQQYYELISKYYQYGPGWQDFPETKFVLPWNGSEMSAQFYLGRDRAEVFNDHYRLASNMVSVLILNHVFSAFDAYFTVNLKNSRLQAQPPVSADQALRFTLEF